MAIWVLVAAAAMVREGGSVLGSVWSTVRNAFRCPGSQVHPISYSCSVSCEGAGKAVGGGT